MPSDSRPPALASTTSNAAAAHAPMSGRNDGTRDTTASAASRSPGSEQGAQVDRLHRTRPATSSDGEPRPERMAEVCRVGVRPAVAPDRVPSHDTDDVATTDPLRQGRADRVVVEGLGQRVLGGGAAARPGVRPRVEGVVVARGVVEVAGGVERRAVGVHRDAGISWRTVPPARRTASSSPSANSQPRNSDCASVRSSSAGPRSVRSRPTTRQPASDLAPLASRRSRSASEVTSRTHPRACFTQAT